MLLILFFPTRTLSQLLQTIIFFENFSLKKKSHNIVSIFALPFKKSVYQKMKKLIWTISLVVLVKHVNAQSITNDSLLKKVIARTTIGGYGDASYQRDFNEQTSTLNLNRFVLFVGHQFNSKISVFSELEVEDAKVAGGEEGGEVALEQAYLQFQLNKTHYLVAGLFLPRIGILNEDHLPTSFNGVERNRIERLIIPSTWREVGVGLYGNLVRLPFNYSIALTNGLNSASFAHENGIREGRYEGRDASANNLALTGAVQFNPGNLRLQVSGYYGGSVGLSKKEADKIHLESGTFGTPVIMGEAHAIYDYKGFNVRLLGTTLSIPDADKINAAYSNNITEQAIGGYGELSYNLFHSCKRKSLQQQKLILFARYEYLDLNAKVAENSLKDKTLNQQHIVAGLTYLPINNVVVKADARLVTTGDQDEILIVDPDNEYKTNNTFLNLGIGFSF